MQPGSVNGQPDPTKTPTDLAEALKGPPPLSGPPVTEEPPSWWRQNGPLLLIVALAVGFLLNKFDPETIAKVAVGLSLVIFIHELGHFLVAKWCDVHVTAFSIGFGPPIPGCSFQWGETTYKLAIFPLGGYVQMVGQIDGDESSDDSEDDPRSYRNKSVGQRMAIISAGVVMNVILAFVCFVLVYRIPGKDRQAPVVLAVDPGAPAYIDGVSTGDLILQIGSVKNPTFDDLRRTVMASHSGEELDIVVQRLGADKPLPAFKILPRKGPDDVVPLIGIQPTERLQFRPRQYVPRTITSPTNPLSPAALATPAFDFGDRIIATTDPADPTKVASLPDDPRYPDHGQCDYFEFARRMQLLAGKEVIIRVRREGVSAPIDVTVAPAFHWSFGVVMDMGQVTAIRKDSPAYGKVVARDKDNIKGDEIEGVSFERVSAKDPSKREKITWKGQDLDPVRLPDMLKREMAKLPRDKEKPKQVTLHLRRARAGLGRDIDNVAVVVDWNDDWTYEHPLPLSKVSPWAVPELGLAYQIKSTVASNTGEIKENLLQAFDEIKAFRITFKPSGSETEGEKTSWIELASDENWAHACLAFTSAPVAVQTVTFKVKRKNETKEIDVTPVLDETWPMTERGWVLWRDDRKQRADNMFEAVSFGLRDTHSFMMQVFENLRGMFSGRLSVKLFGGPITIATVAYRVAGVDFWEFLFFLGMVSVNLAVINFLPIPVLDGGHMVLLIYEKLRGRPASETIRNGATMAGLALIGMLLIFVLYLDISRLF